MKKIVLMLMLAAAVATGLYYVSTYTGASVGSPVTLSITEQGMISLVPFEGPVSVRQGEATVALVATNNMGVKLWCTLEHNAGSLELSPTVFELAPGKSQDISIAASADCMLEEYPLKVTLSASFKGGRAKVNAAVPLAVIKIAESEKVTGQKGSCVINGNAADGLPSSLEKGVNVKVVQEDDVMGGSMDGEGHPSHHNGGEGSENGLIESGAAVLPAESNPIGEPVGEE